MKQAQSPEFVAYQKQVVANASHLAKKLAEKGYKIVTGGTDSHLVWVDLRPKGLNGSRAEKVLELISIACNKNTVPGDKSAFNPGGIRLGTPALTTRGFVESDVEQVVEFIDAALLIALEVKAASPGTLMKDFNKTLEQAQFQEKLSQLRDKVESFALNFSMPGYDAI